jgi:hypothetical protein
MEYKFIFIDGYPSGTYVLHGTDASGKEWCIPVDESNSDYKQYLVDTDGGLPLPKETKEDK